MQLSSDVLEAMGFRSLKLTERITGFFSRIDVFSVQGITMESLCLPAVEETINGVRFKFCIGGNLNEACKILTGEKFIDDEDSWLKDKKAAPPFVLVLSGPTAEYTGTGSHIKEENDAIVTYDSFSGAKDELTKRAGAVIPTLMTGLSISFSKDAQLVRFVPKDVAVSGKSSSGKTIHDMRMKITATGSISRRLSLGEASNLAANSIDTSKRLDAKIAEFFYLGLNEIDPLKRFVYLFIFVEQSIHTMYRKIDHHGAVDSLLVGHRHVESSARKLLEDHRNTWKDLRSRFIWCIMHKWTHLSDIEVQEFEHVKGIRDAITHGSLASPEPAAVRAIEMLAVRIHQSTTVPES